MTSPALTVSVSGVTIPIRHTEAGIVATITPDIARQIFVVHFGAPMWLHRLRGEDDERVKGYARDMREGRFRLEGSLSFSARGILAGGHHRLRACIDADVPFDTYIERRKR